MRSLILPRDLAPQRLLRYLCRQWQDVPEYRLRACFQGRDVKVNGQRVGLTAMTEPGALVEVYLPKEAQAALRVVYEDGDILLTDKPGGMHAQEEDGVSGMETLARDYLAHKGEDAPILCHRLDNQTSGLLLFAKHPAALDACQAGFREHLFIKRYQCLVKGAPTPDEAVLRAYLRREQERNIVHILRYPARNAREIVTAYQTLAPGAISRLLVTLHTGRMHQIRAQLSDIGHPILGDDVYGDRAFNRDMKTRRLCLCACELTLHFLGGRLPGLEGRTFSVSPPF